jgi:para-aminobenzoate synthetase
VSSKAEWTWDEDTPGGMYWRGVCLQVRHPPDSRDFGLILYVQGSMTGAPKKRSVELLQILENSFAWPQDTFSPRTPCCDETERGHERGVYSGVCGYWCVGGGGDFSVIIRSAFKYDDECKESGSERWYVGAGGAITALSDAEAEWEEMKIKLTSTLRAFEHL